MNAALAEHPPAGCDPQRPDPPMLLWAYAHSVFPMADPETGRIDWYSPDPRGVIPLDPPDAFRVPKNLSREIRKGRFEIRFDTSFTQVMNCCAIDRADDNRSWITQPIIDSYTQLHQLGFAHSVEAWLNDAMVGGMYGVSLGGAFFGESMFSRPAIGGSNASKICLVHLVQHLRQRGYTLLDTQFWNEHLDQFGCIEIDADEYDRQLHHAVRLPVTWQ